MHHVWRRAQPVRAEHSHKPLISRTTDGCIERGVTLIPSLPPTSGSTADLARGAVRARGVPYAPALARLAEDGLAATIVA